MSSTIEAEVKNNDLHESHLDSDVKVSVNDKEANDDFCGKFSKKLQKKLIKIGKTLTNKEKLVLTQAPSKILCIQNGGLGNDVCQEDLMPVFTQFGPVECILMLPRKPYSFICYCEVASAVEAFHQLNGYTLKEGAGRSPTVVIYLFYVEKVPPSVVPSHELPPGLHVVENFVTEEEETRLMEYFDMDAIQGHKETGVMRHRQVKHFGYEFKYGINDVDVHDPLPEGIPAICYGFLNRCLLLGPAKHFPDQLTINQYKPGQGIPPHVDTVEAFEDGIMSLSLGSQVVMDFRHPGGQHLSVVVPRRSLLVMTGDARYVWSHGITPRKSDIVPSPTGGGLTLVHRGQRVSLTFRKVVMDRQQKGQKVADAVLPQTENQAVALEREHVQQVYDDIAEHFSGTRYKPWPLVVDFLLEQPPLSLMADVGCGNGKYLGVNRELFGIGSDFSKNLASICRSRGNETCTGDVTCLPFRTSSVDVVLCIAVIHHMATKDRRHKAVSEIVRILSPGGRALIYVWAMEQDLHKTPSKYIHVNRQKKLEGDEDESCVVTGGYGAGAGEGGDSHVRTGVSPEGCDLSTLVEREHSGDCTSAASAATPGSSDSCEEGSETALASCINTLAVRRKEDIGDDAEKATVEEEVCREISSDSAQPAVKKLHVHVNRTQFQEQDMLVPWQLKTAPKGGDQPRGEKKEVVFHRYYHMFRQGELEAVCKRVAGCAVRKSYYDQGNWCVVLEKVS